MDAYWLLEVHNDVDWTDEEALGGEVTREVTTCKDCRHVYEHHDARGRWLLCGLQLYDEVKPEDFCSRGVPVVETRRTSDE